MLTWYRDLYVGHSLKDNVRTIRVKIHLGIGTVDVWLITLAVNPSNQLEIISANELLKKPVRKRCPMIVGIASGYSEALVLVEQIVQEVWEKTGTADVRSWLLENA